jgi:hypothetical protein
MDLLLAILSGAEEAQALFVSTGGLETLLRTVLQQAEQLQTTSAAVAEAAAALKDGGGTSRSRGSSGVGASDGGMEPTDALVVHLLVFLQVLLGWVIGEAVRKGEAEAGFVGVAAWVGMVLWYSAGVVSWCLCPKR